MSNVTRLNSVGGGVGIFVLILAATTNLGDSFAWFAFPLALFVLLWSFVISLRSQQQQQATIAGALILVLLLLSFLPLYGKHGGEPGEVGGGLHRHSIWELGHVH
jgi:hypothetical protein